MLTQDSVQDLPQGSFPALLEERDRWLTDQIRQLSIDVLQEGTFTCTACGEVSGTYIITQGSETYRLAAVDAYAFLQFILSKA